MLRTRRYVAEDLLKTERGYLDSVYELNKSPNWDEVIKIMYESIERSKAEFGILGEMGAPGSNYRDMFIREFNGNEIYLKVSDKYNNIEDARKVMRFTTLVSKSLDIMARKLYEGEGFDNLLELSGKVTIPEHDNITEEDMELVIKESSKYIDISKYEVVRCKIREERLSKLREIADSFSDINIQNLLDYIISDAHSVWSNNKKPDEKYTRGRGPQEIIDGTYIDLVPEGFLEELKDIYGYDIKTKKEETKLSKPVILNTINYSASLGGKDVFPAFSKINEWVRRDLFPKSLL